MRIKLSLEKGAFIASHWVLPEILMNQGKSLSCEMVDKHEFWNSKQAPRCSLPPRNFCLLVYCICLCIRYISNYGSWFFSLPCFPIFTIWNNDRMSVLRWVAYSVLQQQTPEQSAALKNSEVPWNQWDTSRQTESISWSWLWRWPRSHPWAPHHLCKQNHQPWEHLARNIQEYIVW